MKKLIGLLVAVFFCGMLSGSLAAGDHMYLISDSDRRELTVSELWEWDYESLGYILNEIFARHGYDFAPGEKYDVYFRSLPWYRPNNSYDNNKTCYNRMNSIEWYNERLVKQVRQQMRDSNNYNPNGKSVWSHYSSGFDVLQGFGYVEFRNKQSFPVFSAPNTNSWRGANGKASVSTGGAIYAAGSEGNWLLVMYETNNGGVRVGYIDKSNVNGSVTGNTYNQFLGFSYSSATITANCALTDDPARQSSQIVSLQPGTQVTYLKTYLNRNAWAYIETYAPNGQICRGFIPASCINVVNEDSIGEGYENG